MFSRRKEPEIAVLMTCADLADAEQVRSFLSAAGIRCVLRELGSDDHLRIISGGSGRQGVQILVNAEDAEPSMDALAEAGYFQETEELTDEELEELAMSMEEITGLEGEE